MATQKKAYSRSWYLVGILVAITLIGAGAVASGAFAASPGVVPGVKTPPGLRSAPVGHVSLVSADETSGASMLDFPAH